MLAKSICLHNPTAQNSDNFSVPAGWMIDAEQNGFLAYPVCRDTCGMMRLHGYGSHERVSRGRIQSDPVTGGCGLFGWRDKKFSQQRWLSYGLKIS